MERIHAADRHLINAIQQSRTSEAPVGSGRRPKGRGSRGPTEAEKGAAEFEKAKAGSARKFVDAAVDDGKLSGAEKQALEGESKLVDEVSRSVIRNEHGDPVVVPRSETVAAAAREAREDLKEVFDPTTRNAEEKLGKLGTAATKEAEEAKANDKARAELMEELESLEGYENDVAKDRIREIRTELRDLEPSTEAREAFAEAYTTAEAVVATMELESEASDKAASQLTVQSAEARAMIDDALPTGSHPDNPTTFDVNTVLNMDRKELAAYLEDENVPVRTRAFFAEHADLLDHRLIWVETADMLRRKAAALRADAKDIGGMLDDNFNLNPWDSAPIQDGVRAAAAQIEALRNDAPDAAAPAAVVEVPDSLLDTDGADTAPQAGEVLREDRKHIDRMPQGEMPALLPEDQKHIDDHPTERTGPAEPAPEAPDAENPAETDTPSGADAEATIEPAPPTEAELAAIRNKVAEAGPAGLQIVDDQAAVVVQKGQSLSRIAMDLSEAYGVEVHWPEIYEANSNQIDDPNLIFPGQVFVLPPQVYEVIDDRAQAALEAARADEPAPPADPSPVRPNPSIRVE